MSDHCCGGTTVASSCSPLLLTLPGTATAAPAQDHAASGGSCCSAGVPVFDGVDPRFKRTFGP